MAGLLGARGGGGEGWGAQGEWECDESAAEGREGQCGEVGEGVDVRI